MATATLQYRVNNGALHTDSIAVASGDVISQTAASFAGWQSARWEIVAYPPNWSVPSGFTADVSSGYYYYLSNTGPSGVTPPDITIPDPATRWGKWTFRLTVTASSGTVVSADVSVETVSPVLGLHDLAVGEGSQFGGTRKWVGDQQDNARTLDASALVGGGFVSSLVANSPLHVNASTGAVTASWSATGDVPMSSHKITGLADPASAQDAATKAYVDSVAAGLDPKASVFVASTASITLSGTQTVDGVSVTAGKRVLAKDQGDNTTGIYLSAAGSWTRTTDLATGTSAAGVFCFVEQGTANGDKGFVCTNNVGSDVVGTDTLAWTQFSATSSGLDPNTHVWEDAATALNANGVPTRNLASSLSVSAQAGVVPFMLYPVGVQASDVEGFRVSRTVSDASGHGGTSTIVHMALGMPNAVGTDTKFAAIAAQLTSTLGPSGKMILRTLSGGTMSDWVTINSAGDIRFHGTTYASAGGRFVVDASGNITLQAITEAELRTAAAGLTTSLAVNSQKITGLADGSSSSDAAAFGQIGTAVNAAVSGTTNTLAKFTGTNVVGDSGATDDGTTFGTTRVFQVTKAGIGTTATIGLDLYNSTNSGTQYSPMARWSAWNGGTQVNFGVRWEPQSTSRGKLVFYTGTGSGAPSGGGGGTYWDSQDNNFGEGWISNGFYSGTTSAGGSGFRFMHSSNLGGMTLSSTTLVIKSYSANGIVLSIYSDSGSTLTSNVISTNGSGQGYARFIRAAPTSASNAVTFNLATSQNIEHALTENTTVSFSGAAAGMSGVLVFKNDGTGRTVTMPANGTGIEYDAAINALTTTGIVDAGANKRTVLAYYVLSDVANRIYVYARSTSTIP